MRLAKCFNEKGFSEKKKRFMQDNAKNINNNETTLMFKIVFFVFKIKSKILNGNKAFWLIINNIGHIDITQLPKMFFDIFKPIFRL